MGKTYPKCGEHLSSVAQSKGKAFAFCLLVVQSCRSAPMVAAAAATDIPAQLLLPSNMNRRPVSLQSHARLLMNPEQLQTLSLTRVRNAIIGLPRLHGGNPPSNSL